MLSAVIDLYRLIGRPPILDDRFNYDGPGSEEIVRLMGVCRTLPDQYGRFEYERSYEDGRVVFDYIVPAGECSFYNSFVNFIRETPTLGQGKVPEEFYIVSDNWAPSDGVAHDSFSKIENCMKLIGALKGIAAAYDDKSAVSSVNLLFAVPNASAKAQRIVSVPTRINSDILNCSLSKLKLVEYLASSVSPKELHFDEKKSILAVALADIACECPGREEERFIYLLKNWPRVLDVYWKNLQTYLHGFSFDAVRQQIAKAELDYGGNLSAVFGDIAGKILALPLSLGALIILSKSNTLLEVWVTAIGILMLTLIFLGVLINQWLSVSRLRSSFDQVFFDLNDRVETYPKNLRDVVKTARDQVKNQHAFVIITLAVFSIFALTPSVGMAVLVWSKWGESITSFWAGC